MLFKNAPMSIGPKSSFTDLTGSAMGSEWEEAKVTTMHGR
jgi:hypothetical protein